MRNPPEKIGLEKHGISSNWAGILRTAYTRRVVQKMMVTGIGNKTAVKNVKTLSAAPGYIR